MAGFFSKRPKRFLSMEYYDAHLHFFYDCPLSELQQKIEHLEKVGFAGINV